MRDFGVILLVSFFLFVAHNNGQIPNGDFENWSNGNPVGWSSNNIIAPTVLKTNDSQNGSSAVKGEAVQSGTDVLAPLLISGKIGDFGFPISERHASVTGYYKLLPINTENLSIVVIVYKNEENIGFGSLQLLGASNYTNFAVPILYSEDDIPDSSNISFLIGDIAGPVDLGSVFYVDNISFQGIITSLNDSYSDIYFTLEQNYPNPFNPTTTIRYSIPSSSFVTLKVYDVLGNEVASLVDEEKSVGKYEINLDASSLTSGIYFYKLIAGDFVETKKMILIK